MCSLHLAQQAEKCIRVVLLAAPARVVSLVNQHHIPLAITEQFGPPRSSTC